MRLSLKESRMKLLNTANLDRKSGIRGPKMMGEARPQPFVPDSTRFFIPAGPKQSGAT
jgi:hypothetical protein